MSSFYVSSQLTVISSLQLRVADLEWRNAAHQEGPQKKVFSGEYIHLPIELRRVIGQCRPTSFLTHHYRKESTMGWFGIRTLNDILKDLQSANPETRKNAAEELKAYARKKSRNRRRLAARQYEIEQLYDDGSDELVWFVVDLLNMLYEFEEFEANAAIQDAFEDQGRWDFNQQVEDRPDLVDENVIDAEWEMKDESGVGAELDKDTAVDAEIVAETDSPRDFETVSNDSPAAPEPPATPEPTTESTTPDFGGSDSGGGSDFGSSSSDSGGGSFDSGGGGSDFGGGGGGDF